MVYGQAMVPGEQIWSELEPRLRTVHAQLEPMVVAQAQLGPDEGGPPLSRIVAYPAVDPRPHWHFVTCGLSASRFIEGYPDAGGVELSVDGALLALGSVSDNSLYRGGGVVVVRGACGWAARAGGGGGGARGMLRDLQAEPQEWRRHTYHALHR